jgi:predicted RNA polymerase sigma factor
MRSRDEIRAGVSFPLNGPLEPGHPARYTIAHRGLGRALERAGRREEARAAYRKGLEVAARAGDLQTKKEIEVFLRRLDTAGS